MLSVLKRVAPLLIVTIFIISSNNAIAQRWEIGGLLGGTNYLGDISKEPTLSKTHIGINLWGRYNISRHFSYRFGAAFGQISGADSLQPATELRGLTFKSNIWELTNIIEFHFRAFGLSHPHNKKSSFYEFTRINAFYFNPKAKFNNTWVSLQPLATEGQNLNGGKGKYSRVSVSIPIGAGYKFKFSPKWILGFEVGYRKTYTDYLDDVSGNYPDLVELRTTNGAAAAVLSDPSSINAGAGEIRSAKNDMRGDPHLKDWYVFAGITLTYRIEPIYCAFPPKTRRFNNVD
ncbi:MAG: DUF6089 family protein [Bacteroidota bacterium]